MKILVTGANGMLGKDLCPILQGNDFEVIETDIDTLDITNEIQTRAFIKEQKPDFVIHAAAYTNVDKAEEETEKALLRNEKGTKNIAKACEAVGSTMIYISTDYVFDGQKNTPYTPSDKVNPINIYGKTKQLGEEAVKESCSKHYIVRTSWLYGHHGKNFVETMLSIAETPLIRVVDDQTGTPTWTVDLCEALVDLIEEEPEYGIYHICGDGETTWFGFAKEIFKLAGTKVNLEPCKTTDFPRPAKRPKYSVMDNGGTLRNWKLALKEYIELRVE